VDVVGAFDHSVPRKLPCALNPIRIVKQRPQLTHYREAV
jgi:hypothetical protein